MTSDSSPWTSDEPVMTTMSTGEEWAPSGYFGARIGVVARSFAFSCAMKPLSALGSDVLYPRVRVSCERFPVHMRDDDGGAQAEVPPPVPFEDREPVGHEARRNETNSQALPRDVVSVMEMVPTGHLAPVTAKKLLHPSALAMAALLFACGGASEHPPVDGDGGGPGSVDGGGNTGPDSAVSSGDGAAAGCPASAPAAGSKCTTSLLACQYGDDPDLSCDTTAVCQSGVWVLVTNGPSATLAVCPTPLPGASGCPSTYSSGQSCASGGPCAYPQGLCTCTNASPVSPNLIWMCETPAAGCAEPRPRVGGSCGTEGQVCDYGACYLPSGTVEMTCTGGKWAVAVSPSGCPD
jgi:hypothetical protein